jgi:O-antigen ligase
MLSSIEGAGVIGHADFARSEAYSKPRSATAIYKLVLAYVLLVPLIFFASGGSLSVENGARNTVLGHRLGSAADTGDSQSRNVELVLIYGIVLILVAPHLPAIAAVARRNWVIALLAALLPLSAVWSQVPRQTIRNGFYSVVDVGFVFYLTSRFSPAQLMRLMVMLAAAVLVGSAFLVVAVPGSGLDNMEGRSAWQGLLVGKNNCAMAFNFLLMPVLYVHLKAGWERFARIALIGGIVGFIAMSQSRTGWVLCAVNLLLWSGFSFLVRMRKRDAVLIVALGGIATIVGATVLAGQFESVTALIGKDATLTGRTEIWAPLGFSIMKRPLLGYGYSTFWTGIDGESGLVALSVGWVASYAHNGYLEVALQLGLVGLGFIVFSLFNCVRDILQSVQPDCPEEIGWYAAIVVLTIFYNVDESTFIAGHQLIWLLYIVAALGLSRSAAELRTQLSIAGGASAATAQA